MGSLRLATGTWVGPIEPSFDVGSVDNRAIVWTSTSGGIMSLNPEFRTVDFCAGVPEPGGLLVLLAAGGGLWRRRRKVFVQIEKRRRAR